MEISTLDPDCLPEILSALAFAHACEFLEEYSGVPVGDWRYCLNLQALESLGQLPEDQIEKLIDQEFEKEITSAVKITKVHYSALFNTGNYSNERIAMSAALDEGETPEAALEILKDRVAAIAGPEPIKIRETLREAKYQLQDTLARIEKARHDWEILSEFLRAQGIKSDIASMPLFTNLLPLSRDSNSDVLVGEMEDTNTRYEDDDDDD